MNILQKSFYGRVAQEWYFSHLVTLSSVTGAGTSAALFWLSEHFRSDPRMRFVEGRKVMMQFVPEEVAIEDLAALNARELQNGYDRFCDTELSHWGRQNYTVIQSRLSHALAPHGFHVFITCSLEVRALRRCADSGGETLETITAKISKRDKDDTERYEKLYPGCMWVPNDFDLVIDTEKASSAPDVARRIVVAHKEWQQRNKNILEHRIARY